MTLDASGERKRRPIEVAICSPLEAELVKRIRLVSDMLHVRHEPELLPEPRYEADHVGRAPQRSDDEQRRWRAMIASAEVTFDVDYHDIEGFKNAAGNLRWTQLSSAGVASLVSRYELDSLGATFTTAAGVHARPLAEFVLFGMLAGVRKELPAGAAAAGRAPLGALSQ